MAYSFDRVMNQLGKTPGVDDKADIFGNAGGGSVGAPGLGGGGAEGDLSGGDVASGKANSTAGPSDVSSSAAYRSNIGKQNSPVNFGGLRSGVDAKNKALDDEANSYLDNRKALQPDKLSATDADQLHGAIDKGYAANPSGDGPLPYATGVQPRDTLDYWSSVAQGGAEKVDPFKSTLNVQDSTIENLGTDAGVQNLLRRGGGAEYNSGDAGFDQALLSQDQGFQQGRQDIQGAYKGLQDRQNTMGNEVTGKAQMANDSARSSYLADLRDKLNGMKTGYEGEAQAHEKEIEDAAGARQATLLGQSGDVLGGLAKEYSSSGLGDISKYASADGIDAGQYAHGNFDAGAQDWQSYLGDDEALKFNNIFGLLGSKELYGKGARAGGYADADLVNYDTEGMKTALAQGAKGRHDAQVATEEAARVQAAAEETAKTEAAAEETAKSDAAAAAAATAQVGAVADGADEVRHGINAPGTGVKELGTAAVTMASDPLAAAAKENGQEDLAKKIEFPSVGRQLTNWTQKKLRHW